MISHKRDLTSAQWNHLIGWFRKWGEDMASCELTLSEIYHRYGDQFAIKPRTIVDLDFGPMVEAARHAGYHFPNPATGQMNTLVIEGREQCACSGQDIIKAIKPKTE